VNSIVTVAITPVQDPPDAINDSVTTNEDAPITINVLGNDGDPDGDTVTIVAGSASTPTNGTAVISSGKILYTPNSNYFGSDSFTYKITDGNGNFDTATVNISVASVVDPPIAVNDAVATNEDTPISFNVFTNDTNPDGATLLLGATTSVAHGTLSLDSKGNATYTPEKDYNGLDSFNYSIFDQYGNISNATVNITVNSVNDSPIAVSDTASTNEDTAVIINVVKNDTDIDNDPLSVLSTTNGSNGSVIINKDGTLTYTPNANFNGSDSFTYLVKDSSGATSTATVNIAVAPINDNPTPVNDNVTTNEDTAIIINVLVNDTDLDGNSLVVTNIGTPANGSITLNPDKTITYEPYKDFSGVDTFTYTVNDGYGGSATATVTVTVTNVNDAPVAVNDVASTNESTPAIISVLGNDTDSDLIFGDALTIKSVGTAANGALSIVNGSTQIISVPLKI
jgi:VCBS repeat-containing protein